MSVAHAMLTFYFIYLRQHIKDYTLALMVVGLVVMDLLVLITWTIVDPLHIVKDENAAVVSW